MGPPPLPTGSSKHKPSGRKIAAFYRRETALTCTVPEPDAKMRKTLAERGGEPIGSKIAAPTTSRTANGAIKSTLANGTRPFSSASLSRVPSNKASKQATANPFGSSVGYGSRAASVNSYGARPKSAYGTHVRSKSHHQTARPASSYSHHEEDGEAERKGAQPFLISTNPQSHDTLKVCKKSTRAPSIVSSDQSLSYHVPLKRKAHLLTSRSISSPSSLFPTSPTPEGPADVDADDILNGFGALTLNAPTVQGRTGRVGRGTTSGKIADISFKSKASSSLLPRRTPNRQMLPPPSPIPKTPTRAPTPQLYTPFLNKYTNDRCPAFDDSRVASLEAQFETFKEQIKDDLSQQNNLKDSIKLYESRSMCSQLML
jgi:kinesin family protein C1